MIVLPVEKKIDWKRPPFILIALVMLNIIIFVFYQGDDHKVIERAIQNYEEQGLADIEFPAYDEYQTDFAPQDKLSRNDDWLVYHMLMDEEFRTYIDKNQHELIQKDKQQHWRDSMLQVDTMLDKISVKAGGLDPSSIKPINLLTHQFLHGGFMHLFGNMVFLIITGFAVETALGHARFLIYYLVCGVGACLLFTVIHNTSGGTSTNLVGASGSISGVMAMYLALFKLRKIEFFYWVFIFTGYFKSVAIILLPAYILKEIFMLMFTDGSNVAYMAHVGGFVAGTILILITQAFNNKVIDEEYLDNEPEPADPYLVALNGVYQSMAKCNFKQAWTQLKEIKEQSYKRPELNNIEFNILRALNKDKANIFLLEQLNQETATPQLAQALVKYWNTLSDDNKKNVTFLQQSAFIRNALVAGEPKMAEKLFSLLTDEQSNNIALNNDQSRSNDLALLARKIAFYYEELNRHDLSQKYNDAARQFMLNTQPLMAT